MKRNTENDTVLLDSRWPNINLAQIDNVDKMNTETLDIFERMADRAKEVAGWDHHINSSYRKGDDGQHGFGRAIDFYFFKERPGDVPLLDQLLFAVQYGFRGIGYYPYWNTPGLHVDTREDVKFKWRKAIWRREKNREYAAGFTNASESLIT